ncbi:MAG: hypothetical protein QOH69_2580 [Actinomycetota bacterium]|jgi:hypothetical protein|nr:hypothetical protein [Actinomycetota bacterium]
MNRRILAIVAMVIAIVVVTIGGAGVAYAYWTAGGAGTGFGAAGTTVPITLSAGTPTASLLPGGQTGVVLTMTNANAATVKISSLALDTTQGASGFAVDAGHSGCTLSTLSFVTQTNGGAGWSVPGKVGATNGTLTTTLTNALAMSLSAADACQGATFTVYLLGA